MSNYMQNQDIVLIDQFIADIKRRAESHPIINFEICFILTLEIARFEIITQDKMTDRTSEAITQLFAFQAHEFYHFDYPELWTKSGKLFTRLLEYNQKLKSNDLSSVGPKNENWINYFQNSISEILKSNK